MRTLVTALAFRAAPSHLEETGLLGFVSLAINDTMIVHDVAVRRTAGGRHVLSFAVRKRPLRDRSRVDPRAAPHKRYAIARPLTTERHVEIEQQVIAQLRERGEIR